MALEEVIAQQNACMTDQNTLNCDEIAMMAPASVSSYRPDHVLRNIQKPFFDSLFYCLVYPYVANKPNANDVGFQQ